MLPVRLLSAWLLSDERFSEARRKNNALRAHNLDERLAVVFRPDGTESKYYPATMRVLFEYDAEKARALVDDYGLPVDAQREKNLNRFIAHVGKSYTLYLNFTEESPHRGHVQCGSGTSGIDIIRTCHVTVFR